MSERFKRDWRCHEVLSGDTERKTAWGMWVTGPHVALHLANLFPSKSEAISAAREHIGKGWADRVVVRRVTLGPLTEVRDE